MTVAALLPIADTWSMHDGGGWWIWMTVMMVLFVGAIVIGAVWFAHSSNRSPDGPRRQPPSDT